MNITGEMRLNLSCSGPNELKIRSQAERNLACSTHDLMAPTRLAARSEAEGRECVSILPGWLYTSLGSRLTSNYLASRSALRVFDLAVAGQHRFVLRPGFRVEGAKAALLA